MGLKSARNIFGQQQPHLELLFNSASEAIVPDTSISNLSAYNAYFLANGSSNPDFVPYTSIVTTVNPDFTVLVKLYGGRNMIINWAYGPCQSIVDIGTIKQVKYINALTYLQSFSSTTAILDATTSRTFADNSNLRYVNLPKATELSFECLAGGGLVSAYIPNITTITANCFFGNSLLNTVYAPLVTYVDAQAFSDCVALTNLAIGDLTYIGELAFSNTPVTNIAYNSCTYLGQYAFNGCLSLTSVSFNSLTELNDSCFEGCTSLVSVSLNNLTSMGTTLIGGRCFYQCSSLVAISFPKLTDISLAVSCFEQCSALQSFSAPLLDSNVPASFFTGCAALSSFTALQLKIIGSSAFFGCSSLASLPTLASGALAIFGSAFRNCSSLTTFSTLRTGTVGANAFTGCTSLTSVTLGTTSLNATSLQGLTFLQTINLPNIISVPASAFSGCTALKTCLLPLCTNLGGTVANNNVFLNVTGKNPFNLTIPASRMTANAGAPDGDIQYLQANNTCIITQT